MEYRIYRGNKQHIKKAWRWSQEWNQSRVYSIYRAAACFSIYAFEELRTELESIKELKFIFTSLLHNREDWKRKQRVLYSSPEQGKKPHRNGVWDKASQWAFSEGYCTGGCWLDKEQSNIQIQQDGWIQYHLQYHLCCLKYHTRRLKYRSHFGDSANGKETRMKC